MNNGMLGKAIAVVIAIAVVLSLAFTAVAQALTQLFCGTTADPRNLFSGLWLAITGDPATYTTASGCALPVLPIRIADSLLILLATAGAIAASVAYRRYLQSDRSFLADLRTRPGFATAAEVRQHLSGSAVLKRAKQLRPDL